MALKNKPNFVFYIGILASLIFWILDGLIDAVFFEEDESIIESIFYPDAHEIYMRSIVLILFMIVSLIARNLLKEQERTNRELTHHKTNLEEIVSLRTKQLEKIATIDDLTQIYNRRKFFELANYELTRNARYKHPLSIIMIDIDHFKDINDRFGHQTGDITLQYVARTIFDSIRTTDIFGRIGGEEFAMVLPETSKQEAADFAEKIRQLIENEKFPDVGLVTICLGVTQYYENDTSGSLFSRADVALYAAKNAGRNRVTVA
jgi:diguanylate cyclase (GGDEF)-like protein